MKKMMFFLLSAILLIVTHATSADAAFGREQPVKNIENAPILTQSGKEPTLEQVEGMIRTAIIRKDWIPTRVGDGHTQAYIQVREHYAKVDIKYTTKNYSITYNDSKELLYTGTKIHRNYNRWVQNLSEEIRRNLLTM